MFTRLGNSNIVYHGLGLGSTTLLEIIKSMETCTWRYIINAKISPSIIFYLQDDWSLLQDSCYTALVLVRCFL